MTVDHTAVTTPTEDATGVPTASHGRNGDECHPEGDRPNLIDPTIQRTRAWFAATERGEVHAFATEADAEARALVLVRQGVRRVVVYRQDVEAGSESQPCDFPAMARETHRTEVLDAEAAPDRARGAGSHRAGGFRDRR